MWELFVFILCGHIFERSWSDARIFSLKTPAVWRGCWAVGQMRTMRTLTDQQGAERAELRLRTRFGVLW